MKPTTKLFAISALAGALAACGGSGSSSDSGQTGTVSVGLTDAPATDLSSVNIAFNTIRLKHADGEWIEYSLEKTGTVDLLTLQGGVTEPLITDEEVPAGDYKEIRLIIDTDNSWVIEKKSGGRHDLWVPSGEQSGLKLKGNFIVAADTSTNFTIDFDVQKSIVKRPEASNAKGDYMLKPVLRIVNNLEAGKITGEVDYATINQSAEANCSANYEGSVYVYKGGDVKPVDLNIVRDGNNPLMVIPVNDEDADSRHEWTAAFLTEGIYTVSYSCQLDDNEKDEGLTFYGTQNAEVKAGETTEATLISQ
ncbi:DUF4382 domain-containing protein [Marinobacter sp.]|uniref:DUF4382 domain-containing protein n=1 Tax=Marinobacter sp. TaxID=50741 RepID=UPI002B26ECB0|nr:DUF4382 domain-containing protein [Marinobacter sp.]